MACPRCALSLHLRFSPALVAAAPSLFRARGPQQLALCFDHVTPPGRLRIVGFPRDTRRSVLIALPISARARSRSTPPAGLCSQRNTCPIINSHDLPIIGDLMVLLRFNPPTTYGFPCNSRVLIAFFSPNFSSLRFFLFFKLLDLVIHTRISYRALVSAVFILLGSAESLK